MTETAPLTYERMPRRPIPYRRLFVPLGIAVAVVDGAIGLFTLTLLGVIAWEWITGTVRGTQVPLDLCVMLAFSLACSYLIALGGIRSSTRGVAARSYLRAGFAGQLLLNVVGAARLFMALGHVTFSPYAVGVIAFSLLRLVYVGVGYWLYSGMRADLYFSGGLSGNAAPYDSPLPIDAAAIVPRREESYRFLVSGYDARTGAPTAFKSKAATEPLARRS